MQENKTKGQILEEQILRQLTNDLQTMLYLVALHNTGRQKHATAKVLGVRYNVIRRPLSGGKGTIVRHKPSKSNPMGESKEEYYSRVASYIREEPETYFMRWKVQVRKTDLVRFRHRVLDPILQQLCYWYDCVSTCANPYSCGHNAHWQHPFGVRNILDEGGTHDLDAYLTTGSMVGLTRVDRLFEELECGASTATKS